MEEHESLQPIENSVYNLLKESGNREVVRTVVAVMMLAINGGAVLTLPGAFASTGVLCATLLLALVALAQAYTNNMLLWQCLHTKQVDYEGLSNAIAGPYWMVRILEQFMSTVHVTIKPYSIRQPLANFIEPGSSILACICS